MLAFTGDGSLTMLTGRSEEPMASAADPATHRYCTLGGDIGNSSCGAHTVMRGKTVDNVESLEIVTYDGLALRIGATSEAACERSVIEHMQRKGKPAAGAPRRPLEDPERAAARGAPHPAQLRRDRGRIQLRPADSRRHRALGVALGLLAGRLAARRRAGHGEC